MAIADGSKSSNLKFSRRYLESNGKTTTLYFTTYTNEKNDTFLMYQKPEVGSYTDRREGIGAMPSDAKNAGNILKKEYYITAAKIVDGKIIDLRYQDSFYLGDDGTLKPFNSSDTSFILSNNVRADLHSNAISSLGNNFIQTAAETIGPVEGISRNQARERLLQGRPNAVPTASPDAPEAPTLPPPDGVSNGGSTSNSNESDPTPPADSINLSEYTVSYNDPNFEKKTNFGTFAYPNGTGEIGLDFLKIEILKYNKTEANAAKTGLAAKTYSPVSEKGGTIYLGLQASITDQNTVGWTDDSIDPLKLGTNLNALGIIEGDTGFRDVVETIEKQFSDPAVQKFVTTFAAKATNPSDSNLFGRITNSIVNPNMELLFNRPNLRPFNFTFKMVPRDEKELKSVKGIINALKQSSAVQIGSGELFLKTPFVYRLSYMTQKGEESPRLHPSINKIKECALTSIIVDYTPSNVYMTYNDDDATMTAYTMQLQFSELIPVYADDYLKENHAIGY